MRIIQSELLTTSTRERMKCKSANLLVNLSAVVVALLTSTSYGEGHASRMPGSDTGHFPQTLVSLPGKLLCMPATCHTYRPKDPAQTHSHTHLLIHLITFDFLDWHHL